jgi:RES domain-containing protein
MLVYRIARSKYIRDLSGEGARLHGGRWNQKGTPVLYTSEHQSLATLEVLVHTSLNLIPEDLQLLKLDIPEEVPQESISMDTLPSNWRNYPAPRSLALLGTKWAQSLKSLVLRVPSVISPPDANVLINPHHPSMTSVQVKDITEFKLDGRL